MAHMNYLQAEKNAAILNSISKILKQNGLQGAESITLLADKSISKKGWTAVLLDAYANRTLPVYTSELITRINTAHHQEMTQVNSTRKKLIDHLENEISLKKKFQNDITNDFCHKQTDPIRTQIAYETALADRIDQAELVKLRSHFQSVQTSYATEEKLYHERLNFLKDELQSLQNPLRPIRLVSAASN